MKSNNDVEETLTGQADSNEQETPVIKSILDTKGAPANDIDYKGTPIAHGILRTPAIYGGNKLSSVSSGSKKRVRISSPRKIKSVSKLPRMSRSLSPFPSFSQVTPQILRRSHSTRKVKLSSNLTVEALLDPDVSTDIWSSEMATPPRSRPLNDGKEKSESAPEHNLVCREHLPNDHPRKGVARVLFGHITPQRDVAVIDDMCENCIMDNLSLSPPVLSFLTRNTEENVEKAVNDLDESENCFMSPPVTSELFEKEASAWKLKNEKEQKNAQKRKFSEIDEQCIEDQENEKENMPSDLMFMSLSKEEYSISSSPSWISTLKISPTLVGTRTSTTENTSGIGSLETTWNDNTKENVEIRVEQGKVNQKDVLNDGIMSERVCLGDDIFLSPSLITRKAVKKVTWSGVKDIAMISQSTPIISLEQKKATSEANSTKFDLDDVKTSRKLNERSTINKSHSSNEFTDTTVFEDILNFPNDGSLSPVMTSGYRSDLKSPNMTGIWENQEDSLENMSENWLTDTTLKYCKQKANYLQQEPCDSTGLRILMKGKVQKEEPQQHCDLKSSSSDMLDSLARDIGENKRKQSSNNCESRKKVKTESCNEESQRYCSELINMDTLTQIPFEELDNFDCCRRILTANKEYKTEVSDKKSINCLILDPSETSCKNNFGGFHTALGKQIKVSDKSLEVAKKILEDNGDVKKVGQKPMLSPINSSIGKKDTNKSKFSVNPVKQSNSNIEQSEYHEHYFGGFKSCLDKNVEVSDKSINATNKILETEVLLHELNQDHKLSVSCQKDLRKKVGMSEESLKAPERVPDDKCTAKSLEQGSEVAGSTEGSGKKVKISEDSLKTVQKAFDSDELAKQPNQDQNFSAFQIGSAKEVEISEESLKATKRIMWDESLAKSPTQEKKFVGFQTCLGKKIEISNESLKAAKKIFEDNSVKQPNQVSNFSRFQTGSGKKVKTFEESVKIANKIFREERTTKPTEQESKFVGFQTGLGEKIEISEESLKAAQKLFDDDNSVKQTNSLKFHIGPGRKVEIPEESLKATKKILDDEFSTKPPEEVGKLTQFQAGLRKKYEILNDSAKAVTEVFYKETLTKPREEEKKFTVFQTGLGKTVEISEESLKAVKQIFDKESSIKPLEQESKFTECQTALGKKIKICKDALNAAKKIFNNESSTEPTEQESKFEGFQTGVGKKVDISQDSLKAAKKIFDDKISTKPLEQENKFIGFHTGLGKKVEICEDALKAAKKIFDNESLAKPTEQMSKFVGFPTILGKKVEISGDSLKAVKKVFENDQSLKKPSYESDVAVLQTEQGKEVEVLGKSSKFIKKLPGNDLSTSTQENMWLGFKTGQGEQIDISDESLNYVKKIFENGSTSQLQTSNNNFVSSELRSEANVLIPKNVLCSLKEIIDDICAISAKQNSFIKVPIMKLKMLEQSMQKLYPNNSKESTQNQKFSSLDTKRIEEMDDAQQNVRELTTNGVDINETKPHTNTATEKIENRDMRKHDNHSLVNEVFTAPYISSKQRKESSLIIEKRQGTDTENNNMATSRALATLKRETAKEDGTCNGSRMFEKGQLYKQKQKKRKSFGEYVNYFPPQKFSCEELKDYGIPESVVAVTSRNAAGFVFDGRLHFSDEVIKKGEINIGDDVKIKLDENHKIGLDQFISSIMSSPLFDEKLISRKWIENHYKWIVWKLASYEVRYPEQFGNKALTPSSVMQQLKYRYDKEVEHAERSCLKKIYERDDIASRRMVLCISDVLQLSGEQKEQQIELTDGWYAIKAQLDPPLTSFLNEGLIKVGTKLCIYGAELVGSNEGCDPLEAPATLQLKLFTNSTRRASWDSKLGYQLVKIGFYVPLKSLYPDGGMVGRTDLVILRKYPMQWMEKRDGRCIFRSSAGEDESVRKYEERKQTKMEEIYQKIQKEYETKSSSKSRRSKLSKSMKNIKTIRNGKELYNIIKSAADPCTIESTLTSSQKELAVCYHEEVKEQQQEEIRKKFDECWKEMGEEFSERVSIQLQRYRVADVRGAGSSSGKDSGVILTVWKPTQDIIETWDEGVALSVYHLSVSNPRFRQSNASIKLATNNTTKYQILEKKPSPMYIPRKVHNLESLHHLSTVPYGEVDAVGYIVRIHPMNAPKGSDQIVYIADGTRKLVGVKFRGGIDGFCASSSIKPKSQIAFTNLTWPKCSTPFNNKILFLIFSDLASASCNPKEVYLQKALQSTYMKEYLSFVTEMESELDILLSCEYRTNASITSQKIPSNSNKHVCSKPSPQKTPENQTLTNISNDLPSEKLQKRHKLQIKKRLSLEKYRDPPPLLNLSNKDTGVITAQFKPPKLKR